MQPACPENSAVESLDGLGEMIEKMKAFGLRDFADNGPSFPCVFTLYCSASGRFPVTEVA